MRTEGQIREGLFSGGYGSEQMCLSQDQCLGKHSVYWKVLEECIKNLDHNFTVVYVHNHRALHKHVYILMSQSSSEFKLWLLC